MHDFVPRGQMHDRRRFSEGGGRFLSELQNRVMSVCPDVEDPIVSLGYRRAAGDDRSDIVDMREGPSLQSVAEDRHRQVMQQLVHENADHVAVLVGDVLPRAVNVVRAKDDEPGSKHFARGAKIEFDGILCDAVRIFGQRNQLFG